MPRDVFEKIIITEIWTRTEISQTRLNFKILCGKVLFKETVPWRSVHPKTWLRDILTLTKDPSNKQSAVAFYNCDISTQSGGIVHSPQKQSFRPKRLDCFVTVRILTCFKNPSPRAVTNSPLIPGNSDPKKFQDEPSLRTRVDTKWRFQIFAKYDYRFLSDVIIAIVATFFAKAIIAISRLSLSISLEW